MTVYFPTRFAILRERYDERLSEIGRAAVAASKVHGDDRIDDVYTAVRETLTKASLGGVGKSERRLREHLLDELEGLCLAWQSAGEVVHDVAGRLKIADFVSENDAFADLQDEGIFPDLCYVHIGEGTGLALRNTPPLFIDGFFIQPSCLGDEAGTMLTFTCGISQGAEPSYELGSMLRTSGRMVSVWISSDVPYASPRLFGDPDIVADSAMYHALTTAAASIRVTAENVRSFTR
ncbi:hypothetical protein M0654_21860 [Rhizobium sp. NTR19]|uniref:Uncharacterized protein n=1 Tax=Neorhizobium turbinariae TaxID=2937795 RepID=A0ABT0IXM3_9HYPH|nr:hypothetical protein [Neorhizobium turbinariae]MCK8782618.1 hypothetical protein [Neorhizobium turbinariae]